MNDINQQFETVLPQALGFFVAEQVRLHQEDPEYYEEDPTIFFQIEDTEELYEFIMNDAHWIRHWSSFIMKMLVDQIFSKEDFQFSLN